MRIAHLLIVFLFIVLWSVVVAMRRSDYDSVSYIIVYAFFGLALLVVWIVG